MGMNGNGHQSSSVPGPAGAGNGKRVYIFDTTLRDGEQSPGASMTVAEKLEVADALVRLGVDIIEAGFPIASPGDLDAVRQIAERAKGVTVCGLARAVKVDVEASIEALRSAEEPRIHTFISASPIHLEHQYRKDQEQILQMAEAAISQAARFTSNVEFSAMDATRSPKDYLVRMFGMAIAAGATTINVPDTVGYTTPEEHAALFRYLIEHTPGGDKVIWSCHCHNDLGMATANALAAIGAGVRQVECTINGIGERAGNTSLEEVVMALKTRRDVFGDLETNIRTEHLVSTSRIVSRASSIPVQPNKAIVGQNAFAHGSGIHQDGILKNQQTYEIMTPQSVGWERSAIVLTKHSGRHGFTGRLAQLGYTLTPEQAEHAYQRFIALCDEKKHVSEDDIIALIENEMVLPPDGFKLVDWHVETGGAGSTTARVTVSVDGTPHEGDATGNGPVEALYGAIDRATGTQFKLESFVMDAVTAGIDAQATVRVRIVGDDGKVYGGQGLNTNILAGSAEAYIAAIARASRTTRKAHQAALA
jgi:2-isopropylmalate synthase